MIEVWTCQEFQDNTKVGFLHGRNNPLIKSIDKVLLKYERAEKGNNLGGILEILDACNSYLKYVERTKPMGSTRQSTVKIVRDQAFNRLKEMLVSLSPVSSQKQKPWAIIKNSPLFKGKGKIMDEFYWIESIAPHLPANDSSIQSAFKEWKKNGGKQNFMDWLLGTYIPTDLVSDKYRERGLSLLKNNVEYLNEIERLENEITVRQGIFYNCSNERFHTGNLNTLFSGPGWAIFVVDEHNKIYAHSHKKHKFHHSSFLNGGRVRAAGEFAVNNGVLVAINSKSGHYRTDQKMFYHILTLLYYWGVDLRNAVAQSSIYSAKYGFNNSPYFNAYAVMLNNGSDNGLPPEQQEPKPLQVPSV